MEQGYIQSARDIFWSKKKHKVFFKANEDEIMIANGFNGSIIKADFCGFCKKIIVDYTD
jgi:hypothetical protein